MWLRISVARSRRTVRSICVHKENTVGFLSDPGQAPGRLTGRTADLPHLTSGRKSRRPYVRFTPLREMSMPRGPTFETARQNWGRLISAANALVVRDRVRPVLPWPAGHRAGVDEVI